MPQLHDPLDTPKENEIRGGTCFAELVQETEGIEFTDEQIAEVFKCHPETLDYIRNDDEDRCNDTEREGTARNMRKADHIPASERTLEKRHHRVNRLLSPPSTSQSKSENDSEKTVRDKTDSDKTDSDKNESEKNDSKKNDSQNEPDSELPKRKDDVEAQQQPRPNTKRKRTTRSSSTSFSTTNVKIQQIMNDDHNDGVGTRRQKTELRIRKRRTDEN